MELAKFKYSQNAYHLGIFEKAEGTCFICPWWDTTKRRLLVTFAVPLVVGGLFYLTPLYHHLFVFIAPATLIFYGLALVNAGPYTLTDVKYFGYFEIILVLLSLFFLGWDCFF